MHLTVLLLVCSNFKISVCWVFVTIHLHVSNVSLFRGCCWIDLNKSMSNGLSPFVSFHHDDGNNDNNEHSNAAYRDTNKVCTAGLTAFCSKGGLKTHTNGQYHTTFIVFDLLKKKTATRISDSLFSQYEKYQK